ncbi:hypothetical protein [Glaciecola sp. 1036]|uniref:hypothetical protein n=1 Tax=Alteromonadaceae TaxID=72275 RepID=UPI003CFF3370
MVFLHTGLFWMHITAGAIALILFWVPLFTQKGKLNHVRYGHYFKTCMYIVAVAGFLMAALVIYDPLAIKYEYANRENAQDIAAYLRVFWGFLGLLAILTFVTTRHGIKVLEVKDDRSSLKAINYLIAPVFLFIGGVIYFYFGISKSFPLYTVFGVISILLAINVLRYCLKKQVAKRSWILEHIGSLLGSGIGAYTAFLTFGSRRLLDLGEYQLVVWIAPGVIGSIASYILCKKYKGLFRVQVAT